MALWEVFREALLITGFVAVMMMAVEYANVFTQGTWRKVLGTSRLRQYALAAAIGAVPGCLGSFVVVAMYSHGVVSLGAVVACMMASPGDEGFVMLALFPGRASLLILGQVLLGILLGWLTDQWLKRPTQPSSDGGDRLEIHAHEPHVVPGSARVLEHVRHPSALRGVLLGTLAIFGIAVAAGRVGPEQWDATRVLLLAVTAFGIGLVATVSDHFLGEHLYEHVLRQHVPKVFLWTVGALGAMAVLARYVSVERLIGDNHWSVLGVATLMGIIPESGPHLVFTTLYAEGALPFSVLVANTVVQDGHGMLPMLAHSRRDFVIVKAICLAAGAMIGVGMMALGW
jgi:hypothetical protein